MNINYDYIDEYISSLYDEDDDLLLTMRAEALKNHIPVVCNATALTLRFLCARIRPKRILEVGTAIGYSAIIMRRAAGEGTRVVTIERDGDMVTAARRNIENAGFSKDIEVIFGDALEVLPLQTGEFDFIFLDAAKGQYNSFFDNALRILERSGLIVCDNVLIHGLVAGDRQVAHRSRTMTVNMRGFIDRIKNDKRLDFCVIPVGDGVLLCAKKQGEFV